MESSLKEKWIEALRSGRYRQGKQFLKNGYSYCCLGVLCDVFGSRNIEFEELLPEEFANSIGLTSGSGLLLDLRDRDSVRMSLAALNDGGLTFDQIADIIQHFL